MTGDYSRDRFDSSKHYSGVFRQQGRVVLESDANEDVKIRQRLSTVSTLDTVGPKGVPETTPDAFMVGFPKEVWWQNWLTVGPGRIYVDGLLVENHGSMPAFNPELGDLYGTQPSFVPKPAPWWKETFLPPGQSPPAPGPSTPSASVPHYATIVAPGSNSGAATAPGPYAGSAAPQPTGSGQGTRPNVYLAYLDVWQREVDALQAPDLLEPALGVDTTTRTQVAWQVRFCALPKIATLAKHGPCDPQHWEQDERWRGLCAPSRGRLTVTTAPVPQAEDPCELPPSGGYRGRENQLYRVEIHDVLDDGTARFKWSRENASVAAAVVEVLDARTLRVASLGRDDILGFSQGDWVEVLSDADELAGDAIRSGFMAQIAALPGERSIDLDRDLPVPVLGWQDSPQQARDHHLRIRRWDQRTGSSKGGLDSDGLIPVAPGGELVTLEAGIEVGGFRIEYGPRLPRDIPASYGHPDPFMFDPRGSGHPLDAGIRLARAQGKGGRAGLLHLPAGRDLRARRCYGPTACLCDPWGLGGKDTFPFLATERHA